MKRIRIILFCLLCINLISISANASIAYMDDDSCVGELSMIKRLINNIASFSFFELTSQSFDMKSAEGFRCRIPTNTVKFNFTVRIPIIGEIAEAFGSDALSDTNTYTFGYKLDKTDADGTVIQQSEFWIYPPTYAEVGYIADKVCVKVLTAFGMSEIGCKYRPEAELLIPTENCFAGKSCAFNGGVDSLSSLPITAQIIQCIKESLDRLFVDTRGCSASGKVGEYRTNLFPNFKLQMNNIVKILLTISVILFGMKIVLGGDVPPKHEIITALFKMIFVVYLCFGIGEDTNGIEKARLAIQNITTTLAQYTYDIGGAKFCTYPQSLYPEDKSYLAMFDAIDCRVAKYLGMDIKFPEVIVKSIRLLDLLLPSLLALNIFFFLVTLIFVVMFISVTTFFGDFYAVCLVIQSILIYLAPLFVPFILFSFTRSYFDAWLRNLVSYSIQPMIISLFIAVGLTMFDQVIFENCEFITEYKQIDDKAKFSYWMDSQTLENMPGRQRLIPDWKIALPNHNPDKCRKTIGWLFSQHDKSLTNEIMLVFFKVVLLDPAIYYQFFANILILALFAAFFVGISSMITGFAADLAGGVAISGVGGPMDIANSIKDKVSSVASKAKKKMLEDKDDDSGSSASGAGSDSAVAPK